MYKYAQTRYLLQGTEHLLPAAVGEERRVVAALYTCTFGQLTNEPPLVKRE